MAESTRVESLSALTTTDEGKALLAEKYGDVIENVEKQAISQLIKNTMLSGDPTTGSVEAKRFVNTKSKEYGTARSAGKGTPIKLEPVTIKINTDRELIEELEEKDISLLGVEGLVEKYSDNHRKSMVAELDETFFLTAKTEGTKFTTTETEIEDIIEAGIQQIETTKNDFVRGVPRDMIELVCTPQYYGKIRNYLDKGAHNANIDTTAEEFLYFHGVRTHSCINLPTNVNFMVMINGAVAQPVMPKEYTAEKIPLSNAYALELYFSYGTKAVMPDLIIYDEKAGM